MIPWPQPQPLSLDSVRAQTSIHDACIRLGRRAQNLGKPAGIGSPFLPAFEAAHYQHHFGQAQGLIDTAEAALLHLGGEYPKLGERALAGTPPGPEDQRRYQAVVQNILELCWQAMDLMFRTSGASVARRGSLLGRAYRNLAVIRTHITMQGHVTALNVGRLHFGLAPSSAL